MTVVIFTVASLTIHFCISITQNYRYSPALPFSTSIPLSNGLKELYFWNVIPSTKSNQNQRIIVRKVTFLWLSFFCFKTSSNKCFNILVEKVRSFLSKHKTYSFCKSRMYRPLCFSKLVSSVFTINYCTFGLLCLEFVLSSVCHV